jgi:hypothetical protein
LIAAFIVFAVLLAAAIAASQHDEADLGPATKVACTVSPTAAIHLDEDDEPEVVVDPPDIVIAC